MFSDILYYSLAVAWRLYVGVTGWVSIANLYQDFSDAGLQGCVDHDLYLSSGAVRSSIKEIAVDRLLMRMLLA